ncbi:TRAP transporter substrate-binding protein [Erythrobacter sp. EC-HK427]|uniref:TRAP transporter substrate-binding protein n=1 Tax=Erythrobacter sp. EC-HK427 TaxID=2038396 RepID=UPI0012592746|nr:TRAP transporter substrate-binding protein [Erythrobacter sp. EC-HK427]VVT21185.1 Solute-binding protein Bpro_3107 [Erythrobacter sp. EC-HK427]
MTFGMSRRGVLASGAASLMLAGCGRRLGPGLLTSVDTHPEGFPPVEAVRYFGDLLRERTAGRLNLRLYPGGQLGNERDTLEITTFGGIDFNRVNLAPLNSIEPTTIVPALPFLFEDVAHMHEFADGPIGQAVLDSITPHGLIGLCFYDSGARSFYNTRRPIRTPEDMRGLKLRVPGSDLYIEMVRSLGADAVPMPLDEVYTSLAQGVIDGAENNWPSFENGRHFEVAPYYSLTQHLLAPEMFVMSKVTYDALSAEDQTIVKQAARDSVPYMRELWEAQDARSRAIIMASGVEVNEVDPAPFVAAMTGVWQASLTKPLQRELVDRVLALRGGSL